MEDDTYEADSSDEETQPDQAPPVSDPPRGLLRTPANYTPEQRARALWQQQQRLLLLRHASKCRAPPDTCTATPHCAKMKSLWTHIAVCRNMSCTEAHCVSSRFVLSHYHRCRDEHCDVCKPVKDAIRRNAQRQPNAQGNQGGAAQGTSGEENIEELEDGMFNANIEDY